MLVLAYKRDHGTPSGVLREEHRELFKNLRVLCGKSIVANQHKAQLVFDYPEVVRSDSAAQAIQTKVSPPI